MSDGPDRARDEERLLESLAGGVSAAEPERMLEVAYEELHRLAEQYLGRERPDHTLQPTALVHEAWLRLEGSSDFADVTHFFATAARAMRNVLVDHARGKKRDKRGAGWKRVELADAPEISGDQVDFVALAKALEQLESDAPRQALIVDLRYFCGLSVPEVAKLIDVSEGTVARDWRFARAWLSRALSG